ncbi:hypothetical protein ACQP1W_21715 [Spirillospora sp. CA-255316]
MSEMRQTADRLIVIGQGRLLADSTMREFIERHSRQATILCSPDAPRLCEAACRPRPSGRSPHGKAPSFTS